MKRSELKKLIKETIKEQLAAGDVYPNLGQTGLGQVILQCPNGYHFKTNFHDTLMSGFALVHKIDACTPDVSPLRPPKDETGISIPPGWDEWKKYNGE